MHKDAAKYSFKYGDDKRRTYCYNQDSKHAAHSSIIGYAETYIGSFIEVN